jgi:hypothetical protein
MNIGPVYAIMSKYRVALFLLLFCLFYTFALLWGIKKDLPIAFEADESIYVLTAIEMASTGELDPGWYGNPGSTTFYPLTLIFHFWNYIQWNGALLKAAPNLRDTFANNGAEFYLLGRYLSVLFAVMSVPIIYRVGKDSFNSRRIGLLGAGLSILYPIFLYQFQFVRTDSGGLFFTMLALWMIIITYSKPTNLNLLLSGVAIGLAISSRYFMVTLVPVFLVAILLATIRDGTRDMRSTLHASIPRFAIGILAIGIAFVVTTPFFLINIDTVIDDLAFEARSTQLGWDGLSPIGNLHWYVLRAIPRNITWTQFTLTFVGMFFVVKDQRAKPSLLLLFSIVYLISISISPLHWERWIIQVLPIFSLFAIYGVVRFFKSMAKRRVPLRMNLNMKSIDSRLANIIILVLFVITFFSAAGEIMSKSGPSTRMLARKWIMANIPDNNHIVVDKYAAILVETDYEVLEQSWAPPDHDLQYYLDNGFGYIVLNGDFYDYLLAEPDRYAERLVFYEELAEKGRLVHSITPSLINHGAEILIYHIPTESGPDD